MIIKSKKSDQTRKSCKHCQKPLRSDIFLTDNDKATDAIKITATMIPTKTCFVLSSMISTS